MIAFSRIFPLLEAVSALVLLCVTVFNSLCTADDFSCSFAMFSLYNIEVSESEINVFSAPGMKAAYDSAVEQSNASFGSGAEA
jgi:hypothetical protein